MAGLTRNPDFDLEVVVPLTEPRYDTDDNTPRINLRVSQPFRSVQRMLDEKATRPLRRFNESPPA